MIKIPLFQNTSANFTQKIELENKLVDILIQYNIRSGFFHLTLSLENGESLEGFKVIPDFPMLSQSIISIDFEGDFLVQQDNEEVGCCITYDNFGAGWNLYYITPEERETWRTTNGI